MTNEQKLDVLLDRVSAMGATVATMNVHLEYLGRSDIDTKQRLTALERWRFTLAGAGVFAALVAQPLWEVISKR